MCNRYVPPGEAEIERFWHVGRSSPGPFYRSEIFPRSQGPFIRSRNGNRELVVGQWGLIPHFAKSPTLKYNTNNARSEELADKASYRTPWKHGQRCIIPAESFDEPCWETGKNVWWRFRRSDGNPWGLAGLWNTWIDKATGELFESYTMLTINADHHPIMNHLMEAILSNPKCKGLEVYLVISMRQLIDRLCLANAGRKVSRSKLYSWETYLYNGTKHTLTAELGEVQKRIAQGNFKDRPIKIRLLMVWNPPLLQYDE